MAGKKRSAHQPPPPPPTTMPSRRQRFRSPQNRITSHRQPRLAGRGDTAAPNRPPKPTDRALAAVTKRAKKQATRSTHQPPPPRRSNHHLYFRSPPNPLTHQRKPRLAGCGDIAAPDRPPKPTDHALAAVTKRTKKRATRSTHQPLPPRGSCHRQRFRSPPNPLTHQRKPRLAGRGDPQRPTHPPNRPTVHWPQ
jgi:hypothetical protein